MAREIPPFMTYPEARRRATDWSRQLNAAGMSTALCHVETPGLRLYPGAYIEALVNRNGPDRISTEMVGAFNALTSTWRLVSGLKAAWLDQIDGFTVNDPAGLLTNAEVALVMGVSQQTAQGWGSQIAGLTYKYNDQLYVVANEFERLCQWRLPGNNTPLA